MIITIGGAPGSGKSTVGRMLAARLGMQFFSMGDVQRSYATKLGITLAELMEREEHDPAIDKDVDAHQAQLPKHHKAFILDSRLGFHFLPRSIKVYIAVEGRTGVERIMGAQRENERWHSIEEGMLATRARIDSERKRYWQLYKVDHTDLSHYDLVLDSTGKNPLELMEEIIRFLKERGEEITI